MVHSPGDANEDHPGGSAATPPKEGNCPSKRTARSADNFIPLLRRGGSREATDGVVGHLPAHLKKTTPAAEQFSSPRVIALNSFIAVHL